MRTYLEEIAININNNNVPLSSYTFILPSKRAGAFLKKALLNTNTQSQFAPLILSIEEFIEIIANLKIASSIDLLFDFYDVYLKNTAITEKEPFESFSSWANVLLDDFNEIDRNLIDHNSFFNYLKDIKKLEKWGVQEEPTLLIKNYLNFWNSLYHLYSEFTTMMVQNGKAHQGLVYREAANNIEHYKLATKDKHHVFIGFNALNKAEEVLIKELLKTGKTDVYWDADAYFMDKEFHSASLFLREIKQQWNYYKTNTFNYIGNHFSGAKNITVIGCPKNIGQAKCAAEILQNIPDDQQEKTALVLADESLLIPVLNALPENIKTVNITMGLTLNLLPAASFFDTIIKFHSDPSPFFYYKEVLQIIEHPLCSLLLPKSTHNIQNQIQSRNLTQLKYETLFDFTVNEEQVVIQSLFSPLNKEIIHLIRNVKSIILQLKGNIKNDPILSETIYTFYTVWNKLEVLNKKFKHIKTPKTLHLLFKELTATTALDFKGEPYKGLQIMGLLETRTLDFENVILVSVNEGILPAGKSNKSFITYDLKKEYKLPTVREKDAVYTYHFYRLLHRAKNITLLYNNHTSGLQAGEKSRFLLQLAYESPEKHSFEEKIYTPKITIPKKEVKQIQKTDAVLKKIRELAAHGFSPSGLTTYVRNPIDFYERYILEIGDLEEIEETVAANTLGTIVHDTLQHLYEPYVKTVLTEEVITKIQKKADAQVVAEFSNTYKDGNILSGKNRIIFEVSKRFIHNFLDWERQQIKEGNEIIVTHIETRLEAPLAIPGLTFPIKLKGKVDRVDLFNNTIRIIDYKTGKVEPSSLNLYDWESLFTDYDKNSKKIQVLAYAVMAEDIIKSGSTQAGIISLKNMHAGFMPFTKKEAPRSPGETMITREVLNLFKTELNKLIVEICTPNIPFTEKEIPKNDF